MERLPPITTRTDKLVPYTTVFRSLATLSNDHYVGLSISRIGGPFLARTGEADARRMIGRLLTALVDVSEPGGVLVGQLVTDRPHDDMLQLRVVRPAAIRFASAAELLDQIGRAHV